MEGQMHLPHSQLALVKYGLRFKCVELKIDWDRGIDQHNPLIQSRQRAKMWSDSGAGSHAGFGQPA